MKQIVPAKLTMPRGKSVLLRDRLFNLIEANGDKKALWISSPAGSGKTTLVSSYLRSSEGFCLWYLLDEGDADLSTFFYYLVHETLRRLGIGRVLMEQTISHARALGVKEIYGEALVENEAMLKPAKVLGFNFLDSGDPDSVIMSMKL